MNGGIKNKCHVVIITKIEADPTKNPQKYVHMLLKYSMVCPSNACTIYTQNHHWVWICYQNKFIWSPSTFLSIVEQSFRLYICTSLIAWYFVQPYIEKETWTDNTSIFVKVTTFVCQHRNSIMNHKWLFATAFISRSNKNIKKGCCLGGHYRNYYPGTLCLSQVIAIHLKIDGIYGCSIFKSSVEAC